MNSTGHVVVAADGSERNRPALAWAADEAARVGAPLRLVLVADVPVFPVPYPITLDQDAVTELLDDAETRVRSRQPDLEVVREQHNGPAVHHLVEAAEGQRMLVLGKRGLGAFGRLVIGSTSIAVAGRASVPIVVVPDRDDDAVADPRVVVGVDPQERHDHLLRLAHEHARALGASLDVVHGIDVPLILAGDPVVTQRIHDDVLEGGRSRIEESLAPFRDEYPDVASTLVQQDGRPARVLLEVAEGASLLVVGRNREGRVSGFGLGSTARGVLHQSEVPVVVVPE